MAESAPDTRETDLNRFEFFRNVGRDARFAQIGHAPEGLVILYRHDARQDRNSDACRVSRSPSAPSVKSAQDIPTTTPTHLSPDTLQTNS